MADVERALERYRALVNEHLREALLAARRATAPAPASAPLLDTFYQRVDYHFGWRAADLTATPQRAGKLLRPALVFLCCELAAGHGGLDDEARGRLVARAIPAAVAVELVHNFSLIHDDIEDGDEARHHRATLWKLWGVPQAINTGDGVFAIARMELLRLIATGVDAGLVVELSLLLDQTCLTLCEGQYLDMDFEGRHDITTAMYLEMIGRKTAALMACSAQMGGRLGLPDDLSVGARLADFGQALGLAFQVRDDILGIWDAKALGKSEAGDVRRKKMSLPVIAALESASERDRSLLLAIYTAADPATDAQVAEALAILERSGAREHAREVLRTQCAAATDALHSVAGEAPVAREAFAGLTTLLAFVAADAV